MSTVLAIVGAGLGIVGLATVLKDVQYAELVALLGVAVMLLGVAPLFSRAGG